MPRWPEYFLSTRRACVFVTRSGRPEAAESLFILYGLSQFINIYIYIYSAIASLDIYRYIDLEIREILIYRSRDLYNMG